MNASSENEQLAIELFFAWDAQQEEPILFSPLQYSDEPWRSHAAEAWVLGHELEVIDFEQYALSQFILNCGLADLDTWEYIEQCVPEATSLRRFADHWVAWNHSLAGGVSEYGQLEAAARLSDSVTADARDPRTYDLDHWYSTCGDDVNARCEHEPMAKQAAWDARNRKEKPKPEEWGREWELKQNSSTKTDSDDSSA